MPASTRFELDAVIHDGRAAPHKPARTRGRADLRRATDWEIYTARWQRASILPRDDHLPIGAVFQDAPFAPEMVVVPAGDFCMGSPDGSGGDHGDAEEPGRFTDEGPQRPVNVPRPLAVGRFAITFEEWDAAQQHPEWAKHSGLKPRRPDDSNWGRGRRPVIDVSWDDAQAYCRWLTAVTGKPYRLPSEAEWEYCCRAGTETAYWWGPSISANQANYSGNPTHAAAPKGDDLGRTIPVNSFEANPWGLYQMHGNVWEWCQDEWHENYKGAPDNSSAWQSHASGGERIIRGGSWGDNSRDLRSADRGRSATANRLSNTGFRVVRTLSP